MTCLLDVEEAWMIDANFKAIVQNMWTKGGGSLVDKLASCLEALRRWNKNLVCELNEEIKELRPKKKK